MFPIFGSLLFHFGVGVCIYFLSLASFNQKSHTSCNLIIHLSQQVISAPTSLPTPIKEAKKVAENTPKTKQPIKKTEAKKNERNNNQKEPFNTKPTQSNPLEENNELFNRTPQPKKDTAINEQNGSQQFTPLITAASERASRYFPASELKRGKEYISIVSISLDSSGKVIKIEAVSEKGKSVFDRAAEKLFIDLFNQKYAQGFPHRYKNDITLKIPVHFKTNS